MVAFSTYSLDLEKPYDNMARRALWLLDPTNNEYVNELGSRYPEWKHEEIAKELFCELVRYAKKCDITVQVNCRDDDILYKLTLGDANFLDRRIRLKPLKPASQTYRYERTFHNDYQDLVDTLAHEIAHMLTMDIDKTQMVKMTPKEREFVAQMASYIYLYQKGLCFYKSTLWYLTRKRNFSADSLALTAKRHKALILEIVQSMLDGRVIK